MGFAQRLTSQSLTWMAGACMLLAAATGPWLEEASVFRNFQVLLSVAILIIWLWRRGDEGAAASPGARRFLLAAALVWFEATALSRYLGFRINGVDFSIFDWMLESTSRGAFAYSPIYGFNHLGVHSSFLLMALWPLHALAPSPLWLLLTGPLLVWLGLFPLMRLLERGAGGQPEGLTSLALALAYLGNPYTGRLVNAGFGIESAIPLFTLWFLVGWGERRAWILWASALALLCTKEDGALVLASFALCALLVERTRRTEALGLFCLCVAFLLGYAGWLQPALAGPVEYGGFWSAFGPTPAQAAVGMLRRPDLALARLGSSGVWAFYAPLLFLPWRHPLAAAAMAPTVLLLGTASYDFMHRFGTYYPVPLVAFSLWGAMEFARASQSPSMPRRGLRLLALLVFPIVGAGYARASAIDWSRLQGMSAVRAAAQEASHVCAQSILFPHLGYPKGIEPVFDLDCGDPGRTLTIVNPELDPWPLERAQWVALIEASRAGRRVEQLEGGFVLIYPRASTEAAPAD